MSVMTDHPGEGSPDDREVLEPYPRPGEPAMAHLAPLMLALVEGGNRVTYVNENFGFRPVPHGWSAWLEEPIDFGLVTRRFVLPPSIELDPAGDVILDHANQAEVFGGDAARRLRADQR
jgi:hypothetical protein